MSNLHKKHKIKVIEIDSENDQNDPILAIEKPIIAEPINIPIVSTPNVIEQINEEPIVVKPKQKRNITEEHKNKLRESLKNAHLKKKEMALLRKQQLDGLTAELNQQKQQRILMEAERIKRKQTKSLKNIIIEDNSDNDNEVVEVVEKKEKQIQTPIVKPKPKQVKKIYQSNEPEKPQQKPLAPSITWF
jgi:hypothetical protein